MERNLQVDAIIFDPEKAKSLFEEARVVFLDRLEVDFEQLIAFNRAITEKRAEYIRDELDASKTQLEEIQAELTELRCTSRQ